MSRGLSSALLTELATQNIKPIVLVEINFPTPQYITNHYKDIVYTDIWDDALGNWDGRTGLWDDGQTYTATGHLLSIGGKSESSELDVSSFQVELSAVDSAFVSIVLNNNVSNDEVKIDIGLLNENDAIIGTFNYDKGFIESYSINTDTGRLILSCTSHFADFSRIAGRKTNEGSQQAYFSTDKGMEFSALTVQDIKWGRK
jgi:hypothetical protein